MECNIYNRQDYGGYWKRGLADLIDGIFLGIGFGIVGFGPKNVAGILEIVIFLTYMIWFKLSYGATPGYQMLDMKIVSINGAELTLKQIVIRLFSTFFSAVLFGLGYIWIAFDKNKQAWHDKIAGTYVIKAGVTPIQTVRIPQTSLIRMQLFVSAVVVSVVLLIGGVGGVISLVKSSDAYQLSEQYIKTNRWVQQEVGNPVTIGWFPKGNISLKDERREANFTIQASGIKGEIAIAVMLEKRGGHWEIIEAGYADKAGQYIDITRPFVHTAKRGSVSRRPIKNEASVTLLLV